MGESPPQRLPDLCENGRCANLATPSNLQLMAEGDLVLYSGDQLTRFDPDQDNTRSLPLKSMEVNGHLERMSTPAVAPETCDQDTKACFSAASISLKAVAGCRSMRDTQLCEISREAPRWLKAACINGERNLCGALHRHGMRGNDPASARFGAAGRCNPYRAGRQVECEDIPRDPLGDAEKRAMMQECDAQPATCAVHALSTLNVEADRFFGTELARQGCDAGRRAACMVGGLLAGAKMTGNAAAVFYEKACLIAEDELCRTGMRESSRQVRASPQVQTMQTAIEEETPKLCKAIMHGEFQGTSYFESERLVGIRVTQVQSSEFGGMPFEPGDILLDTIRCGKRDCSGTRFWQELARLCGVLPDRLLRDLKLSVRSDVPDRTRTYVLRRAIDQPSVRPPK